MAIVWTKPLASVGRNSATGRASAGTGRWWGWLCRTRPRPRRGRRRCARGACAARRGGRIAACVPVRLASLCLLLLVGGFGNASNRNIIGGLGHSLGLLGGLLGLRLGLPLGGGLLALLSRLGLALLGCGLALLFFLLLQLLGFSGLALGALLVVASLALGEALGLRRGGIGLIGWCPRRPARPWPQQPRRRRRQQWKCSSWWLRSPSSTQRSRPSWHCRRPSWPWPPPRPRRRAGS